MIRSLVLAGTLAITCFAAGTANAQETFHGYDCAGDCSGHEAGYDWAARTTSPTSVIATVTVDRSTRVAKPMLKSKLIMQIGTANPTMRTTTRTTMNKNPCA